MIKYRPHKGLLSESMKECKEFETIEEMKKYIAKEMEGFADESDIGIGESNGIDERISWKSWRYVCIKRCSSIKYDTPQCVGMCDLGELDLETDKEKKK